MSTYLLLRNNKQSGPYTLDQIRALGLKAYDLVWIEGKSAAWRYPCEIEEMKSYAPEVEEQPFDRFFRRPSSRTAVGNEPIGRPSQASETLVLASAPAAVEASPKKERLVHVSQPIREPNSADSSINPRPAPTKAANPPSSREPLAPVPFSVVAGEEDSGEDIGLEYEQKLIKRNKIINQWRRAAQVAVVVIGILGLFAGGVYLGTTMNKKASNPPIRELAKEEPGASGQPSVYHPNVVSNLGPNHQDLGAAKLPAGVETRNALAGGGEKIDVKPEKKRTHPARDKRLARAPVEQIKLANDLTDLPEAAGGQRQSLHRTDGILGKDAVKNNISDYVSLNSNKYNVGTFGGISDLQLTVSNRSLYPLDLVVVQVQYIQANKKVYKTENMYFRGVGAGSALMLEAPRSPRGVKVEYRISLINSKELGLSYTAGL